MKRREYLTKTLPASMVPFLSTDWREQIWTNTDAPSTSESPALRDFLVPESALDDSYTSVELDEAIRDRLSDDQYPGLRQRTVNAQRNWDDHSDQILQYEVASKEYVVVPNEAEDMAIDEEASLTTKALKPSASGDITTTKDDLHRYLYHDWWGADAEPIEDYATDWVEVRSNERRESHRWTEYFVRQPIMYLDPELMDAAGSRRPYFVDTLVIASTDWGVISLHRHSLQFGEGEQSLDALRNLAEELYEQARNAPVPTLDRRT